MSNFVLNRSDSFITELFTPLFIFRGCCFHIQLLTFLNERIHHIDLPPRFQLAGTPLVWSRLTPVSNVEFTQKLPDTVGTTRATDKSSISITPVIEALPPETSEQRIPVRCSTAAGVTPAVSL